MSEINLLPKKERVVDENDQVTTIIRGASIVVLSLTVVVTVVLFILIFQSPLVTIQQKEAALLGQIEGLKLPLSRNVIINERLNAIGKIIQERPHYETYIAGVLDIMPSSIDVTGLEINKKEIKLTGNTPLLDDANTYFNALVHMQDEKKIIRSVMLQSLILQKDTGKYYFTLTITLI